MTRDKALEQKNLILAARAWSNRLLFQIITIFDNCIIEKSHKMDSMTIAERARAVGMLVFILFPRQLHATHIISLPISLSVLHNFLESLQHG